MMGEADPLNKLKRISGIRTAGDYGSGLMVDGNTAYQTLFRIDGAPVFFPYRFGGMFSSFNGTHFQQMNFERGFHNASFPSRLGAKVDFITGNEIETVMSGTANIGMTSSSMTLKLPVSKQFELKVSGRVSYIDEIYGKWLRGNTNLGYKFHDLNLTGLWEIDSINSLIINGFFNKDKLYYSDDNYTMDNRLSWGNQLASIQWTHRDKIDMKQRIYWSRFYNDFYIVLPQVQLKLPSDLAVFNTDGELCSWIKDSSFRLSYGYEFNAFTAYAGNISILGFESNLPPKEITKNHAFEERLFFDFTSLSSDKLTIGVGLSPGFFHTAESCDSFYLNPRASLSMKIKTGTLSLHVGKYTQYIHQVGFSQIGLASDFWILSQKSIPVESSYNFEFDYTGKFRHNLFSAGAYFKIIRDEPEYEGQIINLLDIDYDPLNYINSYNGFNYGIRLNANISYGNLRAQISSSYGRALRRDSHNHTNFKAASNPGLSVNAELQYTINHHWTLGTDFRFANDRPYTPAKAIYMIGSNLITEYGKKNSASFPATHQLDLSATWKTQSKIKKRPVEFLINFSFINAYDHKNVEIMNYVFDSETGRFGLKKVYSLYRFFPSLSFTLNF